MHSQKSFLETWIAEHEGVKLYPYQDTVGKTTIGFGRNLQDNGITLSEALMLMRNDISNCKKDLACFTWYNNLPEVVKDCIIHMCYNLGLPRLLKFERMIAALEKQDYVEAAKEALDSKWAQQVGRRANDIANTIQQGHTIER